MIQMFHKLTQQKLKFLKLKKKRKQKPKMKINMKLFSTVKILNNKNQKLLKHSPVQETNWSSTNSSKKRKKIKNKRKMKPPLRKKKEKKKKEMFKRRKESSIKRARLNMPFGLSMTKFPSRKLMRKFWMTTDSPILNNMKKNVISWSILAKLFSPKLLY